MAGAYGEKSIQWTTYATHGDAPHPDAGFFTIYILLGDGKLYMKDNSDVSVEVGGGSSAGSVETLTGTFTDNQVITGDNADHQITIATTAGALASDFDLATPNQIGITPASAGDLLISFNGSFQNWVGDTTIFLVMRINGTNVATGILFVPTAAGFANLPILEFPFTVVDTDIIDFVVNSSAQDVTLVNTAQFNSYFTIKRQI